MIPGIELSKVLGEGGMATVYKGVQTSLDRPVAVKVLKQNLLAVEDVRQRFIEESRIIAKLTHPNIIQIIDQGITKDGSPYFIMPFVPGVNLRAALAKSALSMNFALEFFAQIAKALAYAHKNNIVHCDIKPENILVDFEGHTRILDFGIAQLTKKLADESEEEKKYILGSENYMAPEQLLGSSNATAQSDIYALGVIMYEYFTNTYPKKNISPAQINQGTPAAINTLIMECIQQSPAKRVQDAQTIYTRILRVLDGKHINEEQRKRAQNDVTKSFQLLDVIREDKFGSVYLFSEQSSQNMFIIKKKPNTIPGYAQAKELVGIKHPNIAQLYGTSRNARAYILVQEYCEGGSLADRLIHGFNLDDFYSTAVGIAKAMRAAHEKNIVHGNLRPK